MYVNIPDPKIGALQMDTKKHNGDVPKNGSDGFD
jgi:hypothetical protein